MNEQNKKGDHETHCASNMYREPRAGAHSVGSSKGKTGQPCRKGQGRIECACSLSQVRWSCCEGTDIAKRAAARQDSFGHSNKQGWKKPDGSGNNPQCAER